MATKPISGHFYKGLNAILLKLQVAYLCLYVATHPHTGNPKSIFMHSFVINLLHATCTFLGVCSYAVPPLALSSLHNISSSLLASLPKVAPSLLSSSSLSSFYCQLAIFSYYVFCACVSAASTSLALSALC